MVWAVLFQVLLSKGNKMPVFVKYQHVWWINKHTSNVSLSKLYILFSFYWHLTLPIEAQLCNQLLIEFLGQMLFLWECFLYLFSPAFYSGKPRSTWSFFLFIVLPGYNLALHHSEEYIPEMRYLHRSLDSRFLAISQPNLMQDLRHCITFSENNIPPLSRYSRSLSS